MAGILFSTFIASLIPLSFGYFLNKFFFKNKNINENFDTATEDLRVAVRTLGKVVGKVDVEEILSSIFNDFCIGK